MLFPTLNPPQRKRTIFFIAHPGFFVVVLVVLFQATFGIAQSLDSTNLPAVWLRADKANITATGWSDYTGYKRHATAVQGEGPSKDALFNYNPAVTFDGVNDYMKIPYSAEGLSEITIMTVFETADTTERGVWGAENALSRRILLTSRRAAGPDSAIDHYGKNERFAVLSTVAQNWNKTVDVGPHAFLAIGSAGKQQAYKPFKGLLAEFLVFNRRLDFLARVQYETYLGIKYGIPVSEGNYVNSAQQVLWHAEQNKGFRYRVAGIGRDDAFQLHQKQARSAFDKVDFLILSAGKLAKTNEENRSVLRNGDFLVWGDNNGTFQTTATPGELYESIQVLNRRWLLSATGNTASEIKTQLRIDLKQLPYDKAGYWLVVEKRAHNNFTVDNLTYILPDSISSDSIAFFRNIQWDKDRSGKDAFSFARVKDMLAVITAVDSPLCTKPNGGKVAFTVLGGKSPFTYELTHVTTGKSERGRTAHTIELSGLAAGEYFIRIADANRKETFRKFKLYIPDAIPVDLGPDQYLESGQTIVLDATTQVPSTKKVSYEWKSSYGYTSDEGRITVAENGVYTVYVTDEQGCVFSDAIAIKGAHQQRFEVFPTITTDGRYNVSVSLPENATVTVTLYDLKGNRYDEMLGENNSEYHFTGQIKNSGMYLVMLRTPRGVETKKIIVY
jgi:hypothetical protein